MSYGPQYAAGTLKTFLAGRTAAALAAVGGNGVAQPPQSFDDSGAPPAQIQAGEWPAVMVDPMRLVGRDYHDRNPATYGNVSPYDATTGGVWDAHYQMRVVIYTRGERQTFHDTGVAVRTLCAAVRLAIESDLTLGTPDCYIDPHSITEAYSDVTPTDDARTMAGAFLQVDLHVIEEQPELPAPLASSLNTVTSTVVNASKLK